MNKERDLLPWILGALSVASIAVAVAAVSTHKTASALPPTQVLAAQFPTSSPPAPATAQAAPDAVELDSAPPAAPPQAQQTAEPQAQGGQIWECTTKGVKTFSNNPCGEKSALLDVGPVNTMNPPPAMHYAHAYRSDERYSTHTDQDSLGDAQDYSDQYDADAGGNSYPIVQGVGLVARRRPEHFHRPPSHHNPVPVRRY